MPTWLIGAVRTALQALWGIGAAWLVAHHVPVPAEVPAAVQLVVLSLIAGAFAALIQWAERRAGSNALARLVRWLARVLMLGATVAQYPRQDEATTALRAAWDAEHGGPGMARRAGP